MENAAEKDEAKKFSFGRYISLGEALTMLSTIAVLAIGAALNARDTQVNHEDRIKVLELEKDHQTKLHDKLDAKFDNISTQLMEIKILLQNKQDRKFQP